MKLRRMTKYILLKIRRPKKYIFSSVAIVPDLPERRKVKMKDTYQLKINNVNTHQM